MIFMALLVFLFGAGEAAFAAVRWMLRIGNTRGLLNERFVRFGRWLVLGLTFQLAADVIETATTTTEDGWADIGRLAAIAVIRTFLSYFLEWYCHLKAPKLRFFVTWYGSIGGHKSTNSLSGKRLN
ncbi:MAG: DUF1622 domain-containing protein, partial [Microcystis sp.]